MNEGLLRFQGGKPLTCFDLETEGLHLLRSKVWQYGSTSATIGGPITKMTNKFVYFEDLNLSKGAAVATRFDKNYYLSKAENAEEVLGIIDDEIKNADIITGHNTLGYDIYVLRSMYKMLGYEPPKGIELKFIDTLALSRAIKLNVPPPPQNRTPEEFFFWQIKLLSTKPPRGTKCSLGVMAKENGLEVDEGTLHDASVDTKLNVGLFQKLIWQIEI